MNACLVNTSVAPHACRTLSDSTQCYFSDSKEKPNTRPHARQRGRSVHALLQGLLLCHAGSPRPLTHRSHARAWPAALPPTWPHLLGSRCTALPAMSHDAHHMVALLAWSTFPVWPRTKTADNLKNCQIAKTISCAQLLIQICKWSAAGGKRRIS